MVWGKYCSIKNNYYHSCALKHVSVIAVTSLIVISFTTSFKSSSKGVANNFLTMIDLIDC